MSDPATSFYVILGCAVRGLYDTGESPQDIFKGVEFALASCTDADPAAEEAGRVFAEAIKRAGEKL